MCHWVLRVWKCGDSFFTKSSSCSFDRAAYDPAGLLNPLHSSITPTCGKKESTTQRSQRGVKKDGTPSSKTTPISKCRSTPKGRPKPSAKKSLAKKSLGSKAVAQPSLPTIDLSMASNTHTTFASNGAKVVYPRNPGTGQTMPIPLSEIGKASRFGDKTLEGSKCNVFEVVLQSKEETMCPACARSEQRAQLPAHARGCFGLR